MVLLKFLGMVTEDRIYWMMDFPLAIPIWFPSAPFAITYAINTHDASGVVMLGNCKSLEEARKVFSAICEDLRYKSDWTVKDLELVQGADACAS